MHFARVPDKQHVHSPRVWSAGCEEGQEEATAGPVVCRPCPASEAVFCAGLVRWTLRPRVGSPRGMVLPSGEEKTPGGPPRRGQALGPGRRTGPPGAAGTGIGGMDPDPGVRTVDKGSGCGTDL